MASIPVSLPVHVAGPFLVVSGDNDIYLKINERNGYSMEGTRQATQASLFYVIPTDNGEHPYEFLIGWVGDSRRQLQRNSSTFSQKRGSHRTKMMKYLDAHVNILGRNSGPLQMRNDMVEANARFSLRTRLYRYKSNPVDLREWVSGKDRFFVHCSRRGKLRIDGYLAVKRAPRGGDVESEYTSVCVSSIKHHNEVDTFMLFSLISPPTDDAATPSKALSPDQQAGSFIVGASPGVDPDLDREVDEEFDAYVGKGHKLKLKDLPEPGKKGPGLEMTEITTAPH